MAPISWFSDNEPSIEGTKLLAENLFVVGPPIDNHIVRTSTDVTIKNMTLFPGHLTRWGAIKWGVLGVLRLGPLRVQKLKRIFVEPFK